MKKVIGPKWVKKANNWCVTIFKESKSSKNSLAQTQEWFSTQEEAQAYIDNLDN